ncbi:transmembrane protein 242 [Aethina tumida]|uniref:transmembrane protein 242 n=1 Tax=Aethina tumida TaxID=116153 RepID=UPI00096B1DEB|nr:transmembrane protein 242 [Aethina tumida]
MEESLKNELTTDTKKPRYSREFKIKAATFLAGVSGISAIFGFAATLNAAKKADPQYFGKGLEVTKGVSETGASLALRALAWGTLYSFTGCGILFYSIWKISGANNIEEFRQKVGTILPSIPKNNPPQGRTEFSGMNDLLDYLQNLKSAKDK